MKRKIAVIGAGWSGLSAAVRLSDCADIVLFEAGKSAGGRARTLAGDNAGFSFLDNGQHIMLYAYRSVRHLMDKIGVDYRRNCAKLPLQWYLADGLRFQTASLPAPLHLIWGILRAEGIAQREKTALFGQMWQLKKRSGADTSVGQWLREQACPPKLLRDFWRPLVLGALNTPLETASLNILQNVLRDGIWAEKDAAAYLLPKTDLGSLLAVPAVDFLRGRGAEIRFGERVGRLEILPDGRIKANGKIFDAAVLAVAPYHAAALLPAETPPVVQTAFSQIRHHAITTVYLRYAEAVRLPAPMCGLADGNVQWFFQRSLLGGSSREVSAVVSASDQAGKKDAEEWIRRADADLRRICPDSGALLAAKAVTEKRATAASEAGRQLPDCRWLQQHNIYPAGDYLHPRYPATLEAAVQSGNLAAEMLLNQL
ncbi:protoporphyrinogen oxidase [Kingella potus]|uniref:Protoporphyrinogen oxidase n=1 Tax=Kingella potus TaxID=265175 RepID=A0A377QZR6_9NEIS|nr:protoporphyrinogen oxidase [Kingella potus]